MCCGVSGSILSLCPPDGIGLISSSFDSVEMHRNASDTSTCSQTRVQLGPTTLCGLFSLGVL